MENKLFQLPTEPIKLDAVNTVGVYVRVLHAECVAILTTPIQYQHIINLAIVGENGESFTIQDMEKMALNRDTIGELGELCTRRIELLKAKLLPKEAKNIEIEQFNKPRIGDTYVHLTISFSYICAHKLAPL